MAVKPASFSLFSKLDFSWTSKIVFHSEHMGTIHTISSLYVCVCACTCVCLWVCKCIFVWRFASPPRPPPSLLSLYISLWRLEASISSWSPGSLPLFLTHGLSWPRACEHDLSFDTVFPRLGFHVCAFRPGFLCVFWDQIQVCFLAKKVL